MCPVIKPNGKVRVTVDFKRLNQNVKRPNLMLCNLKDIAPELVDSKFFSTLDLSSGFFQLPLAEESRLLTTFITPFGRYYFNRVSMGINIGPEEFQRKVNEVLSGVKGAKAIMDDILIYGKTREEHNQVLNTVLEKIEKNGLKLNKEKCAIGQKEVKYFGHMISKDGIRPSPDKIEAIKDMPPPKNISDLRTIMGMLNYHAKFVHNLATMMKPMSDLLKSDTEWYWGKAQEKAFSEAKTALTEVPSLRFYRCNSRTVVSADASSYGLGAVLLQEHQNELHPVAYASRTLTSSEKNYAQIEKEGLASVWACEKFSKYLVGLEAFELWTDHKPLVPLMTTKDLNLSPVRLQKILLRMMRFNAEVHHVPGKQLVIADALSRGPVPYKAAENQEADEIEFHVSTVQSHWPVSMTRQAQLKTATVQDTTLQQISQYILHGWPRRVPAHLMGYEKAKGSLSIVDGLLTYENSIVIPQEEQTEILKILHESHQGFDKCNGNAKRAVWWPNLTTDLKNMTMTCSYCLERKPAQRYEPMKSADLPSRPWEMLGTDLCQVKGHTFLVVIDYYSRWLEVKLLKTTTSEAVIKKLKEIFAAHGIPDMLLSDNGPQYISSEFAEFSSKYGFTHTTSSPYFPHGNAEAERAVQTAKRIITQQDPDIALLNYRATPHSATKVSPAEALMGRRLKTRLPVLERNLLPEDEKDKTIRTADQKAKKSYKEAFDKRHGVRSLSLLEPGEPVLMKDDKVWKTAKVIEMADGSGRSYDVETDQGIYRRNRKDLQAVPPATPAAPEKPENIVEPPETSEVNKPPTPMKIPTPRKPDQHGPQKIATPTIPRTSGRIRRPPPKYQDFVKF